MLAGTELYKGHPMELGLTNVSCELQRFDSLPDRVERGAVNVHHDPFLAAYFFALALPAPVVKVVL